jgi:hypothetical protein
MSARLVTPLALWLQMRTHGRLHVWLLGGVWMQELRHELPGS